MSSFTELFDIISGDSQGRFVKIRDKISNLLLKRDPRTSTFSIENLPFEKFIEHILSEKEIFIGPNLTFIDRIARSRNNHYGCFYVYNNNTNNQPFIKNIEIIVNGITTKTKIGYKKICIERTSFTNHGCQIKDEDLYNLLKLVSKEKLQELKNYLIKNDIEFLYDLYINKDYERTYKLYNGNNMDEYIEIE